MNTFFYSLKIDETILRASPLMSFHTKKAYQGERLQLSTVKLDLLFLGTKLPLVVVEKFYCRFKKKKKNMKHTAIFHSYYR